MNLINLSHMSSVVYYTGVVLQYTSECARSRRRLGLGLGLLYSRKPTALAGAERVSARRWELGLIRAEARVERLWPKALRATLGHTLS